MLLVSATIDRGESSVHTGRSDIISSRLRSISIASYVVLRMKEEKWADVCCCL